MNLHKDVPHTVKVYLSGPMTGIEEFNRPAFDTAAEHLRGLGFEVFVPGEHDDLTQEELLANEVSRARRHYFLSRDIDYIQEVADAVVVIPGWDESEGAKLEVAVAQAIGVPVFNFRDGDLLRNRVVLEVQE